MTLPFALRRPSKFKVGGAREFTGRETVMEKSEVKDVELEEVRLEVVRLTVNPH